MKINSFIWDYDGTLVDTRMKNFNVTKTIVSEINSNINFDDSVLNSLESYEQAAFRSSNWRDLYRNEFGLNEKQIDYAGKVWTQKQLLDNTDVQLIEGIGFTVQKLSAYSQGVVSQNSSKVIRNNLEKFSLGKYFGHIVGYEEVDFSKQKPNPEGLLTCISKITSTENNSLVVYVGDHITDMECAHNANERVGSKVVVSILLNNNKRNHIKEWKYQPDYIANRPEDIIEIVDKIVNT